MIESHGRCAIGSRSNVQIAWALMIVVGMVISHFKEFHGNSDSHSKEFIMHDDSISLLTGDELTANTDDADVASNNSLQSGPKNSIKVKYNRNSINFDAFGDISFGEIKKEIEKSTGVPASEQELIYNGSAIKLRDDKTPHYYRISVGGFFVLRQKQKK